MTKRPRFAPANQRSFAVYRNTVMRACLDALEANFLRAVPGRTRLVSGRGSDPRHAFTAKRCAAGLLWRRLSRLPRIVRTSGGVALPGRRGPPGPALERKPRRRRRGADRRRPSRGMGAIRAGEPCACVSIRRRDGRHRLSPCCRSGGRAGRVSRSTVRWPGGPNARSSCAWPATSACFPHHPPKSRCWRRAGGAPRWARPPPLSPGRIRTCPSNSLFPGCCSPALSPIPEDLPWLRPPSPSPRADHLRSALERTCRPHRTMGRTRHPRPRREAVHRGGLLPVGPHEGGRLAHHHRGYVRAVPQRVQDPADSARDRGAPVGGHRDLRADPARAGPGHLVFPRSSSWG